MTRFLASVRSAEEAAIVLEGGADLVDAKEPRAGALGRVEPTALAEILREVAGRRPVSATIGDLLLEPRPIVAAVTRMAGSGVDIVKIGIFAGAFEATLEALRPLARDGVRMVAVAFADRHPVLADIVDRCAESGFYGVMLDTAEKGGGPLTAHLPLPNLSKFAARARERRLFTGLAGSLRVAEIAPLQSCGADYLGFRSALTAGGRSDIVDLAAVRRVRAALDQPSPSRSATAAAGAMSAAADASAGSASGSVLSRAR
jgi:uncharacterized protein (UPF0264 family)